jgi:hypothetical protein
MGGSSPVGVAGAEAGVVMRRGRGGMVVLLDSGVVGQWHC